MEATFNDIRRQLLDLTRNNRLLNHRNRGQRTLQIVDERADSVYKLLVEETASMQFLSREEAPAEIRDQLPSDDSQDRAPLAKAPEPAQQHESPQPADPSLFADTPPSTAADTHAPSITSLAAAIESGEAGNSDSHAPAGIESTEPSDALPELAPLTADAAAERHHDKHLQTVLTSSVLQARLVNLAREAASAFDEQGCNILYLTMGIVQWREADESSVVCRAPLIFVPVELHRKSVNTRYSVHAFDDDIIANPCLVELCRTQFKCDLPTFDSDKDTPSEYFARVQSQIDGMAGWKLLPELHLGLFSFSKLLMYRDLDERNWPADSPLGAHPLVRCLSGMDDGTDDKEGIPDPNQLDQLLKPAECFQVVDADSSQQSAILAAKRGLSLVIDGPPGTGKSQTITNIIAECLAEAKTVLFVSEKAAALDVVKRRLEQQGMGDFALELHSRKASRKAVLAEIGRVIEKQVAIAAAAGNGGEQLQRVRDDLNAYHRQLHEPLESLGISPFVGMSRGIAWSDAPTADCEIPDITHWTGQQLADACEQIATLDRRLGRVGDPAVHPWRGVGCTSLAYADRQRIAKSRVELIDAIANLTASPLSAQLNRPSPTCVREATDQLADARLLADAPAYMATAVADPRWNSMDADVQAGLSVAMRRQQLMAVWSPSFRPEAEMKDWHELLQRRIAMRHASLRFLRPSWHADSARIKSFMSDNKLPPVDRQIQLLTALAQSVPLRRELANKVSLLAERFAPVWKGIDTEAAELDAYAKQAVTLRHLVTSGRLDQAVAVRIIQLTDRSTLTAAANAAQAALDRVQNAWTAWLAATASNEQAWLGSDWPTAALAAVAARLVDLASRDAELDDWVDLHRSLQELSNTPLKSFAQWLLGDGRVAACGKAAAAFQKHFYRLWVDAAFSARAALRGFRGQDHEALIARFRELDRQWLDQSRLRLAALLAARRPTPGQAAHRQSKLGLLQAEIRKKSRQMTLRNLLANAGEVVQSVKPCFMMSPLSVAQYLAPGAVMFDVIVFDEASQVEPADAYGAVARGRQLILVGDEKQLPPTDFFTRADAGSDGDGAPSGDLSGDLESILSLGIVRLKHRCVLRWHYRSRHDSLIDFSNRRFYDGQLRVFPSPRTDRTELGLAFQPVKDAVYLRGAGRYNPIEAKIVAAAVIEHALRRPELTLGVGTLNQPQQRAIEDEIETLRRGHSDPRVEEFFTRHPAEPFFVKNLENIQGDERDVIHISIGFGKDPNGRLHANFGALNSEGGWRRLNVLITRARRRCVVFSSIVSDDIDLGATQAQGVVALKEYLYAAEHGQLKDTAVPEGGFDSGFEASVCRALRDAGWEVHTQVGCAGFAIDLAVVDPRLPGRYLLGIECDGATYHSSPTARDRDRLRQSVLEGLGWTIFRIWSTDWFHRPGPVRERLLARLKELRDEPLAEPPHDVEPVAPLVPNEQPQSTMLPSPVAAPPSQRPPGVAPYVFDRLLKPAPSAPMAAMPPDDLAMIVRKLVETEGPIHVDEAARACAEMFGTKLTARPREAFDRAVAAGIARKRFVQRGEFLWTNPQQQAVIRYRGDENCPVTSPDLIAPEELEAAIKLTLAQQFGVKFDAIMESTARLFGFSRTGPRLKTALEQAIVRLDQRGEIRQDQSGFVTLVSASGK